jgi:hypothetical protein
MVVVLASGTKVVGGAALNAVTAASCHTTLPWVSM